MTAARTSARSTARSSRLARASTALAATIALTSCTALVPFEDLTEDSASRCANAVDDDFDGDVDCDDADCDGFCPEASSASCSNCRDDDGNGYFDHADPGCWSRSLVRAGVGHDETPGRCSSRLGSTRRLAIDAEPWRWHLECAERGDCAPDAPWAPDPTGAPARVAKLAGGEGCRGAAALAGHCDFAIAPSATTGGACWELEADLLLEGAETEVAVVIAPEIVAPPLGRPSDAVVVTVARAEGNVTLTYLADGRPEHAVVADADGWIRLRVATRPDGPDGCGTAATAHLAISLAPVGREAEAVTLDRRADATTPLPLPAAWPPDVPLGVALQAVAPGTAWVRTLTMARQRFDPCGHPVPQIAGDGGAPAVVLAAARGGGSICALGATTTAPHVERRYQPRRHHAWPPALGADDPAPAGRRFASWRAEDRGVESFGTGAAVEGPARASALEGASVRAAALAWDEAIGFEGVLLVSDEPRRGGRLVRVRSHDCVDWAVEPLDALTTPGAEPAHPLLYELAPRRLVLATPGRAYRAGNDARCCDEPECPALDPLACSVDPHAPAACFAAPADPVPYVKPLQSECMLYPRATLTEATLDGARWTSTALGALPALPRWILACGCVRSFTDVTPRVMPSPAHQLLERGGHRAFVVSGPSNVELVVDAEPGLGDNSGPAIADGVLMPEPLLAPSGIPGTFDAERVAEGHLLVLGHRRASPACPLEALLFYRGFDARNESGDLVAWSGGAVGVIPVTLAPRAPERQTRACIDRGGQGCEP